MKLQFEAPKNGRFYHKFVGVQCEGSVLVENYWWDKNTKKWTITPRWDLGGISNTFGRCRSVKAFRRRMFEWSQYLPEGLKFRLISRYKGCDVIGICSGAKK